MSASPNRVLAVTAVVALAGSIAGIGAFLIASRVIAGTTVPAVIGFLALAITDAIALAVVSRKLKKRG